MKILVTGCRGFVAGTFGRCAAKAGHAVLGVARSGQPDLGWPGSYFQADVAHADLSGLARDFKPDVVFHGAGTASVGASMVTPLDDWRAATMTWANTLDCVRRSGLTPLMIFPSSAAVYGNPSTLPVSEDAVIAPLSPYGFHKAACELLAREYAECFGMPMLVCRLFSVFGPAQRRLLVWELFEQIVGPEPVVWLQGLGTETRDYLSADDVASAILLLAAHKLGPSSAPGLTTVNVASGEEVTILDLARTLLSVVQQSKEVRCRGARRLGDPARWQADTAKLQALASGWTSSPLDLGLAECFGAWHPAKD